MDANRVFFRRWTLACGLAEFAGIGVAGLLAGLTFYYIGEPVAWPAKIITLAVMLLAGAAEGWLVGAFQAKVLIEKIPNLSRPAWVRATVAVAVAGWFLGMLPSTILAGQPMPPDAPPPAEPPLWLVALGAVGMGLVAGAVFGLAQQRVLRRYLANSRPWIIANSLAWGAGLWWVYLGASWEKGGEPLWMLVLSGVVSGLLMGLTVGAVTGWFLLRMVRDHESPRIL